MSAECTQMPGKCPDNRCHWTCRDSTPMTAEQVDEANAVLLEFGRPSDQLIPRPAPTQQQVLFWGGPEDGVDRMIGLEAIRNGVPILTYESLRPERFNSDDVGAPPLAHTYNPWRLALDDAAMRHRDTPKVITVLVHSSWGLTEVEARLQSELTPYVDGST